MLGALTPGTGVLVVDVEPSRLIPLPNAPLAGIRVCDLTWVLAGPQATQILAEFGADVIKVESVRNVDDARMYPPRAEDAAPDDVNASGYHALYNRSKRSIQIDVRNPAGLDLLKQLIAVSDVVVENFSSRVLENWGLTYEELGSIRPNIIYCSMAGLGHRGRDRDHQTFGPTVQALSGLTYLSGLPGREPAGYGYSYMDNTGGYYAAMAILTAIFHRNRTGQGQYLDLAQVEAAINLTGPAILDSQVNGRPNRRPDLPAGNRSQTGADAPHGIYPAAGDDRWIAISVLSDEQWLGFREALGTPEWTAEPSLATAAGRAARQDDIDARVAEWTRTQDPYAAMRLLQAHGVPAGVVQNGEDILEHDEQHKARGFFEEMEHPVLGRTRYNRPVARLSATPGQIRGRAPLHGEHTRQVLGEVLGLDTAALDSLEQQGAFYPVEAAR